MARQKIKSYNAIKGICAIAILFSHMVFLSSANSSVLKIVYDRFLGQGALCTTMFVLLSGFFVEYTWKNQAFSQYIKGKLKRIYPLYLIVFLLAIVANSLFPEMKTELPMWSSQWWLAVAVNIIPLKAFVPFESFFYSFHGPSWYISFLFIFYIVSFIFLRNLHDENMEKRKVTANSMLYICIGAYVIQFFICIFAKQLHLEVLWLVYVNPWFRIFGEGFAGILLAYHIERITNKIKRYDLEGLAVILFLGTFIMKGFMRSYLFSSWIEIIPMSLMIVAFYMEKGKVSKILGMRGFQFLGTISFELYMLHSYVNEGFPVFLGLINKTLSAWFESHLLFRAFMVLILSIIVAFVAHWFLNVSIYSFRKNTKQ